MSNVRAARRYAVALLNAAPDERSLETMATDLATVGATLQGSRDLRRLLASPVITSQKKASVFRELFKRIVGKASMDLLELLTEKNREILLPDIISQFHLLRDERMGIVNVDVSSAVALSEGQQRALQEKLGAYTRKTVRLHFLLDKAVRGGIVVKIGDTVLDASLSHQLELLRERFAAGNGPTN